MKLPQLSLRDLFWLVALVAMGCGWWVDRRVAEDNRQRQAEFFHNEIHVLRDACNQLIALNETETNGSRYVAVRPDGTISLTPKASVKTR